MAAIFGRSWLPAIHGSTVQELGDYIAIELAGRSILIVKSDDGTLRAFWNLCGHVPHRLLEGSGALVTPVACPRHDCFHALEGEVQAESDSDETSSLLTLRAVPCAMFAGFLFVCFDEPAYQPLDRLQELEDLLLRDHPRLPAMREVRRRVAEIDANWKTIIENYLECYHCDVAHPSFGNFDLSTWKHIAHHGWTRQGRVGTGLSDRRVEDKDIIGLSAWWQWPNIFWARALGNDTFVAAFHEPIGPNRTRQTRIVYALDGVERDELRQFNELFDDVFHEDISVVESVQRGLGSRGYRGGVLIEQGAARAGWSEHGVHHFQDLVRHALGELSQA